MTNINEMTFGVEIECYVNGIICGNYHNGREIPGFPAGWNAQHDGSLGAGGVEVVSPVLKGAEGLRQLVWVCNKLNEMGARVNRNCGFHVHVGFNGNAETLEKVVRVVANFEHAIFATTGTHNRENNHYCRGIRAEYQGIRFDSMTTVRQSGAAGNRYHLLNLANLVYNTKPTIEFRAFAGTTSALKAVAHVRTVLGLVERALEMSKLTTWTAKEPKATSPIHRDGPGYTEVARMFYWLGWTKGRTPKVYANIEAEGIPTIKETKKELVRLAKKYDATPAR